MGGQWCQHRGRERAVGTLHFRAQCLQMGYERRAGCLPLGGGSLGARRGRQDLGLILQELAHEAEVGRDHTPPLLDVIKGVL